MKKTICAGCRESGGVFVLRGGKWYHKNRCTPAAKQYHAKSTFPFVTGNIGGDPNSGPTTVNSLHHLRQLENTHGLASEVYNNDSSYQGERY